MCVLLMSLTRAFLSCLERAKKLTHAAARYGSWGWRGGFKTPQSTDSTVLLLSVTGRAVIFFSNDAQYCVVLQRVGG